MHEKKMSTGVVRIRMNTCTILGLIILPFLLFMLYVVLFSECTYLLRNNGYYKIFGTAGSKSSETDETTVRLGNGNYGTEKMLSSENESDKNNIINNIESDNIEDKPNTSVAYQVINLLFLLPVSNEDESTASEDKSNEDTDNYYTNTTTYDKDEEAGKSNKLLEEDKQTKCVQPNTKFDKATSTSDLEKSLTEDSELPKYEPIELGEYNPFFGPLFSYGYDSWDFSIPNTLVCPKNGEDLYLMIIIHSDARNFEQRQAIRETWGRLAKMEGITYAFILAIAADNHLDNRIKHESDEHKDIILTDLSDMVTNETAKSVIFFKWLMYYCPKVKYVFKTNDNVFVNLPQLAILLKDEKTKDNVMYGFLYEGYKPERDPKKENYVSVTEFESDIYPNYLASEGYIFPGKFASVLYKTALSLPYMHIENVFVTGILAEKLNIAREDVPLFSSTFPDLPKTEKCNIFSYTVVFHPLTAHGFRLIWDDLKRKRFECGYFLESVKKMIPEDKRLYSGINEKVLYPLLMGENWEHLDTNKNEDEKDLNLTQTTESSAEISENKPTESGILDLDTQKDKDEKDLNLNQTTEYNSEISGKISTANGVLEFILLPESDDTLTSENIENTEKNSEELIGVSHQENESADVPENKTQNEIMDPSADENGTPTFLSLLNTME